MRLLSRTRWKLTDGERARVLAFMLVGFSSAGLGFLAVLQLDQAALFLEFSRYQMWIVVASAIGGMLALFLAGDRLGQPGARGALRAAAGGIWLTFVGALIGGTLSLPLYGTMFGPFTAVVLLAGSPMLALLWVFNLVGVHILLRIYQAERDSIFYASKMRIYGQDVEPATW